MDTVKIGAFIAERRKLCGLTQQSLADELGLTNKAVSKWETGLGMPDVSVIPALAEILGVTVDELLAGEAKPTESDGCHVASVTEYLVNKSVTRFNVFSVISGVLMLIGLTIPFFIWGEGGGLAALLFGSWIEFCSAGVFFVFFAITNTEIRSYNKGIKSVENRINARALRNKWLRFYFPLWLSLPIALLVFGASNIISLNLTLYIAIGAALLAAVILLSIRLFGASNNTD